MEALEARTMAKVSRRLIPFLILCYFVAHLDRVNLSFAALEMNKNLGFTSTVYGAGAGMFFISYFLLETPSKSDPRPYGRAPVDCPHHVHLGHPVGIDGFR